MLNCAPFNVAIILPEVSVLGMIAFIHSGLKG